MTNFSIQISAPTQEALDVLMLRFMGNAAASAPVEVKAEVIEAKVEKASKGKAKAEKAEQDAVDAERAALAKSAEQDAVDAERAALAKSAEQEAVDAEKAAVKEPETVAAPKEADRTTSGVSTLVAAAEAVQGVNAATIRLKMQEVKDKHGAPLMIRVLKMFDIVAIGGASSDQLVAINAVYQYVIDHDGQLPNVATLREDIPDVEDYFAAVDAAS